MKVLHINQHYGSAGGAERYLAEICGEQVGSGWDTVVLCAKANIEQSDVQRPRIYTLTPSFGLRSARRAMVQLKRILKVERPDIVHLHNVQYFLGPSLLSSLRACAPVVKTVHDARVFCPRWPSKIVPSGPSLCTYPMGSQCFRRGCYPFYQTTTNVISNLHKFYMVGWEMAATRKLDCILVSSRYMREQLLLNGFPPDRIVTLPMFPSLSHRPKERGKRNRRIAFVGRIEESKGIREFLASLALLPPTDWTAHVAGDGPFLEEAKSTVARYGLQNKVKFLGWLHDRPLQDLLASTYVLVLPSLIPESFGLIGLEATASGTPVVAFDSGGISEWLKDGETGFLVPWRDVDALTHRLIQLMTNEPLAESLGRKGMKWASHFDKAQHVNELLDIYQRLTVCRHDALTM